MKTWTPKRIASLRKQHGLSRAELGELLGVSRIHVFNLEKGERISSRTLQLLLDCVEEKLNKRKGEMK